MISHAVLGASTWALRTQHAGFAHVHAICLGFVRFAVRVLQFSKQASLRKPGNRNSSREGGLPADVFREKRAPPD